MHPLFRSKSTITSRYLIFVILFFLSGIAFAQTAQPRYPINGDKISPNPKFTALASSLVPGLTYNIVVSEQPRGGGAGVDQYIDFWTKEGVPAESLLDTNLNRIGWDSTWIRKTRNGNYAGAATVVPNATPSALPFGKTYYWHIYGNNGTKSIENTFSTLEYRRMVSGISPANGTVIDSSSQSPCFTWGAYTPSNFGYYTVMVSTTPDFPSTRWMYQINSATTTSACWNNGAGWASKGSAPPPTPGPLQNGTTYYWRVLITYSDGAILNRDFVGSSFTYRAASSSSPAVISSSRSSSSVVITSSSRSSSSAAIISTSRSSSSSRLSSSISSSKSSSLISSSKSSSSKSTSSTSVIGTVATPTSPVLASTPTPTSTIDLARALPAEFDVTNSGQATYKIPVVSAPGTAGLAPNVSLNYSSGGGNGIAGLGWSLSTHGAISRCRQTEGVDGVAKPITWTSEDRFCLNGDRLLLASGTYGASGSTYKTEIDSFVRVTAVGGISGHPDYFTVEYKDGIIENYGNTSDSYNSKNQLSSSNTSTVLDWALSKRTDSAGNKIVYNYVKDTDGQRIDTIDYAFGATSTRGAYLQFNYETRNDPISGYVAGHSYKTGKRISNIKSYNGTTEIRAYTLTYNQGSAYTTNDKLSRINKIQECVGSTCSSATDFEWELSDYQLASTTYTKAFPNGISVHAMGDLNGDGISDLVWLDQATGGSHEQAGMLLPRKLRYAFGVITASGEFSYQEQMFSNISYNGPMLNARSIKITDINNDGRMDVVVGNEYKYGSSQVVTDYAAYLSIPMPDGTWKLSASASESYSSPQELLGLTLVNTSTIEPDLNGDGLQDAIVWPIGDLPWDSETFGQYPAPYVALRNFSGGYSTKTLNHILGNPSLIAGIDFENLPNANFTSNMDTAPILKPVNLHGDFNGDGAVDFIADVWQSYDGCYTRDDFYRACDRMDSATIIYTAHKSSTGNYELRYHSSNLGFILDNWDSAIDLNNDGLTDIVSRSLTSGWGISINNGLQLPAVQSINVPKNQFSLDYASQINPESVIADINGDGYQDFVWQKPTNAASLIGPSEIKVKYWDPSVNQFEAQERTLGSLSYKIIQNYNASRQDPRMINVLRFKTDSFSMTDVNGDGVPDLVTVPNTQTNDSVVTIRLGVNTKKNINKIVSLTTGLGEKKKISYGRVNESSHYSRLDGINPSSTEIEICENVDYTGVGDTYYTERMCWKEAVASVDTTQFYKNIHDSWHYLNSEEQSLRPASPVLEAFGPMSVVTDVEVTAPSGSKTNPQQIDTTATAKLSYYYGHAKMQAGGRGFLGFKKFTVVNRETGIRTETEYRQDWPFIGQVRKVQTFTGKGHKLSEQFNTWGFVNCHDALGNSTTSCVTSMSAQVDASGTGALGAVKPFLRKSITETRAITENDITEGAVISNSTETSLYDTKGNVLESSSSVTSDLPVKAISKKTVNTYDYSGATWSMQQGRLQRLAVTANDATYGAVTRTSSFTYYPSGADIGLLQTETIEPDNSLFTVTTTHSYSLGNRTKSVTTANSQTRQNEVAYDARGRYVDTTYGFFTNGSNPDAPIRQIVSQVASRDKYGTPTESRNYISASAYVTKKIATTTFGTPYFTADSSGAAVEIKMGTGTDAYGVCPADTKVWSTSQALGGGTSIQCSDIVGRTRRAGSIGFDGANWSLVDTEYDKLGRTLRTSAPYWRNSSERYWTSHSYDLLGRVTATQSPYKSSYVISSTRYNNLDVEIRNPKGQIRLEKRDLAGQVIEVIDPNNGITKFAYDARGNMREMRDPALNTTTVGYDLRDRKTSMSDPDKGNWVYKYNSFGDLVCQMDGNGQTSVQRYDIAGRVFSRTDRNLGGNCDNATGAVDKYTQWTYDTAAYGLGQLASVSDSTSVGGSAQYQQSFVYDIFGRASSTTTTMPGHLGVVGSHYEKVTYDQYGRVFQSFDAARTSNSFTTNGVQNIYNAQGYLNKTVDAVSYGGTQQAYYTVKEMNARGNVTKAEYGNGVTQAADYYPETGLTKTLRADRALVSLPLQDITLDWDELGNLDWRQERGTASDSVRRNIREDFDYDNLNRLKTWISSGDLIANETANYNSIDNITDKTGIGNYLYGNQCGAGTNAGPHALCKAGTTNYNYDKNGNMLNDSAGRTMKYTSYDLPSEISKAGHKTEFSYGPSRARYKRVDTASSQVTTTLYLGSVEKVYYPDGSIQWKRNIAGVGLITQTVNSSGVKLGEAQRYLIKDHLGSLSLITDEIGAAEQSNYFDPWGRERKIITSGSVKQWLADNANFRMANKPITTRGFTGHEQLAEVGLIHMNGRIYDGMLGRFVQADPIIQDPMRVQSLNRYSYVWNNPLNATDPSGFCMRAGFPAAEGDGTCPEVKKETKEKGEKVTNGKNSCSSGKCQNYTYKDKNGDNHTISINKKDTEAFEKEMAPEMAKGAYSNSVGAGTGTRTESGNTDFLAANLKGAIDSTIRNLYNFGATDFLPGVSVPETIKANDISSIGYWLGEPPQFDSSNFSPEEKFAYDAGPATSILIGALVTRKPTLQSFAGTRSTTNLVQEVATRAENKIGGIGAIAGTLKHSYAKRLLERYQRRFGGNLQVEQSFLNRGPANYGTKGSVRLDVWDPQSRTVYDYKFVINPGKGLSTIQQNKIGTHGPIGITKIVEVNP